MIDIKEIYHLQLVLIWCLVFLSVNMALLKLYPIPKSVFHNLDQKKENVIFAEFCAYFSSFLNALICFFFGLLIILENGIGITQPNKDNEALLIAFTTGYFICDTITSLVYKYNGTLMNIHHAVVILNGFYTLYSGFNANLGVLALIISELSNIFRAIEQILAKYPEHKRISFVFGICFACTFLFCRLILSEQCCLDN